jgi:hypothetical protein
MSNCLSKIETVPASAWGLVGRRSGDEPPLRRRHLPAAALPEERGLAIGTVQQPWPRPWFRLVMQPFFPPSSCTRRPRLPLRPDDRDRLRIARPGAEARLGDLSPTTSCGRWTLRTSSDELHAGTRMEFGFSCSSRGTLRDEEPLPWVFSAMMYASESRSTIGTHQEDCCWPRCCR